MRLKQKIRAGVVMVLICALLIQIPVAASALPVADGMINGIRMEMVKEGGWTQIVRSLSPALDMSHMEYIALEVGNSTGAGWGFEVHLLDSAGKNTTLLAEGPEKAGDSDKIQIYDQKYTLKETNKAYYGSIFSLPTFGGWMLIPKAAFRNLKELNLTDISAVTINFNCFSGNAGLQVEIGKIGWFSEKPAANFSNLKVLCNPAGLSDEQLNKELLLDDGGGLAAFKRVRSNPAAALKLCPTKGDVRILEDMKTGYPTSTDALTKAMKAMVYEKGGGVDPKAYSDNSTDGNAMRYDITGPVEGNVDYYSAVTFVTKSEFSDWGVWNTENGKKAQGVTFWVKNLSDYEVSLGFEIDEFDPGTTDNAERWSLQAGTRALLYDTETKQQYIVQSAPYLFIPVGFTGWVRVPFTFYTKAQWCTWGNNIQDFVNVPQIAIISDSSLNQGLSFAIDNLGVYYDETFASTEFYDSGNSLPERMGLK